MEIMVIERDPNGEYAFIVYTIPREQYDEEINRLWRGENNGIERGVITNFTILAVDDGNKNPETPVAIFEEGIKP